MTLLTMATDVDLLATLGNITTTGNNTETWGNNVTTELGEHAGVNYTTPSGLISWNVTTQSLAELKADPEWPWLATLVLLVLTLGVNAALVGVTCRATQLHTTLHALLASLALADILNALFVMPIAINAAIHGEYSAGNTMTEYTLS